MQVFTPWGLLSGTFFVFSMIFTLFAIQNLGLSSASGLWCGTAGAPCAFHHLLATSMLVLR